MPRRQRLSEVQRAALVGVPTDPESLARCYTLDARDRALIRTKRGDHNRLGYAVQVAYLHFPGVEVTNFCPIRHIADKRCKFLECA